MGDRLVREEIEWLDIWIEQAQAASEPRVLMIGDSITRSYYGGVAKALEGKAACARLATSKCVGDPLYLAELELVLGQYSFELIHFNNGLHGMEMCEAFYAQNFPGLLEFLHRRQPAARLVWASSTPWRNSENLAELHPNNERVRLRNQAAREWTERAHIPIDDLFGLVVEHPEYSAADGIHFNEHGQEALARQVSAVIARALAV